MPGPFIPTAERANSRQKQAKAVLVNIVGDIDPDKLAELGRRFDIDVLKRTRLANND